MGFVEPGQTRVGAVLGAEEGTVTDRQGVVAAASVQWSCPWAGGCPGELVEWGGVVGKHLLPLQW